MTGEGIGRIFEHLLSASEIVGDTAILSCNLDYQKAEDHVEEGDLIPVVSISLRPATLLIHHAEPNLDVHPGPVADQQLP